MNRIAFFIFVLIVNNFYAQNFDNSEITSHEIKEHISFLASDELEGRFTGSEGEMKASEYIAGEFKRYGLSPLFDGGYIQEFPFIEDIRLTDNNRVSLFPGDKETHLKLGEDFITAPFSGSAGAEGEAVFVGYGISAPKLNYDDYEAVDVEGKIVIALRHSPEYDNPHSDFDAYSSLRRKTSTAKEHGAAAIIFVNGRYPENIEDDLIEFKYDRVSGIQGISAVHIKRVFADKMFAEAGLDFESMEKYIIENKKPKSAPLPGISVEVETGVVEIEKKGRNVAGILEGSDPELKNQYIVIGAHYDHLGYGKHGSLYRGTEKLVHNGADDNASGTTGVLELAEKFSSVRDQIKRSIIFITFSGEELGLLGSAYVVANSPVPAGNIEAMINMDMIGRLDSTNSLTVFGTGTSTIWKDLLNRSNKFGLNLTFNDEGYGPSDHSSFYGAAIPVLFFFTGTHQDYHRPSDDTEKINFDGEERILKFVYETVKRTADGGFAIDYVNMPRQQTGNMGGWKVYVGTIPDYSDNENGFRISGVSEGSPAQKGGIKGGDIMIKFGENNISNIYDYVYALQEHAPGDIVDVKVLRDDKELVLQIILGAK